MTEQARDIRAFGISPLASRLELFWTRATYLTKKNTHLGGRPDEIIAQRRKWLEIARETRIHSTFRRHAWRCVTSGRGKSDSFFICNAIGMKCSKNRTTTPCGRS